MKQLTALVLSLLISLEGSFSQDILKTMLRLPDTGQKTSYTNTFGEDNDYTFFAPFFIVNNNGTVLDTITGLMWQKADGGEMTIENAVKYADTLTLGGYTDWRLPNIKELQSINDETAFNPSVNKNFFNVTTAKKYWSSTTLPNQTTKAWYLNTQFGITTYDYKSIRHNLVCVRTKQPVSSSVITYSAANYQVYPNPFSSSIQLLNKTASISVTLYNSQGVSVYSGLNLHQQNFQSLPKGIYYLKVNEPSGAIYRLIKE
jgi:hypothetical protein